MNPIDVEQKYAEFRQLWRPSSGSINYLKHLARKEELETPELLDKKDMKDVIRHYQSQSPLTPSQQIKIFSMFSFNLQDISTELHRDIHDLKDLTYQDFLFLTAKNWVFAREIPIICTEKYEYGIQKSNISPDGRMHYLRFYDLIMIDYDKKSLEDVKYRLSYLPYIFRLYQTYNGYHAFLTSFLSPYNSERTRLILNIAKGDIKYNSFCIKHGFKVRLSPKINRDEPYVARYLETINNTGEDLIKENDGCLRLLMIYNHFLSKKLFYN